MRIAELTVFSVRIPFKKKITHASHSRSDTDSLVVRCRLTDGTEGWGEGLPRPYVTGENLDQAWDVIRETDLATQLGGEWSDLPSSIERLLTFDVQRRPDDDRGCFGNSARCAIELSVLDALCRAQQQPLSTVTALLPMTAPIRMQAERVRYSGAFTAMTPWKQIKRAVLMRVFGFHQAKVKVGVPGVDDVALMKRLRSWLGSAVDIRIDANEAWTCANLREKLEPLRPFSITAVEQPVPHADIDGLAAIRPQLGVPIMHDESLCSETDARRAIERGTCDLFNIRLSKCGGFLPSLKLAVLAQQAGLGYQLGCQVGETGILSAAGRHFATTVKNIRYLEGSYDRFLVAERLTKEDLTFGWGGYAPALKGSGLGITIDPTALQRVMQKE
jgi:L-Ala-D/L-Glu epimerase